MLFTKPFKERIAKGEITATFRVWKKPMAKAGGVYNIPPFGAIEVKSVEATTLQKTPAEQAIRAGFADKAAVLAFLKIDSKDPVYIVRFDYLGKDPVKVPDRSPLEPPELDALTGRLVKIPWAQTALTLIRDHPQTRAGDLAPQCDMALPVFKRNVRRLKSMGLTISHEVGYELSERGHQALAALETR